MNDSLIYVGTTFIHGVSKPKVEHNDGPGIFSFCSCFLEKKILHNAFVYYIFHLAVENASDGQNDSVIYVDTQFIDVPKLKEEDSAGAKQMEPKEETEEGACGQSTSLMATDEFEGASALPGT